MIIDETCLWVSGVGYLLFVFDCFNGGREILVGAK